MDDVTLINEVQKLLLPVIGKTQKESIQEIIDILVRRGEIEVTPDKFYFLKLSSLDNWRK